MVPAPAGHGVAQPEALQPPGVGHDDVQALHLHRKVSPLPKLLGGSSGSVGEDVPEALPFRDFLDQGEYRVAVPPGQVEAVCLLLGQQPPLVEFHGPGDALSRREGVQAEPVAEVVGLQG